MDYESMKVDELKAQLKKKGLSTTGRKADLISRLKDAEGDNEEHEEKEEKTAKRKAPPKRGKAKVESEEEEEEEEEEKEKPAKKTRGGRAAAKKKEVEEDEEEEEEEEKPKPKAKKVAAKKEKAEKAEKAEKQEKEEEDDDEEKPKAKKGGKAKVDKIASSKVPNGTSVVDDYDCMLNQTNIKNNNNKYYIIQLLENGGRYWTWNRWGRVGEDGQNKLSSWGGDLKKAKADFEKKFKDKTKNVWADRADFEPVSGKYTMLEMSYSDDEDMKDVLDELDEKSKRKRKVRPCSLPKPTQELVQLVSNHDMFKTAMKNFDIDVNKMPLGKISQDQIQKGYDILEEIEDALENGNRSKLERLCSQFYTNIPHDFGRRVPPLINSKEDVQKKKDMLAVLGDIEIAQGMFKDIEDKEKNKEEVDHPLDVNYKAMNAKLEPVDEDSKEYKIIEKYLKNTCGGRKLEILDVFSVDRKGEQERFETHDDIKERKLLWHGTNVAVIMAIMKTGLRIMPHSGGRVGRGLYFASENSKSANYVSCAGSTGIMLLNEVVLGKSSVIVKDDPTLVKAPKGFESVLARGWTEPDPKDDVTMEMGGHDVVVPVGKPIKIEEYKASYFTQSEYLVYQENQVRIRYLLKLKFN